MASVKRYESQITLTEEQQAILYKNYYKDVFKTIYYFSKDQELSKDLTNEAYLIAFQKIHTLKNQSKFKCWICRIALNLAKDYIKRHKRIVNVNYIETLGLPSYRMEDEVIKKIIMEEEKNEVVKAITKLEPHYKEIIILRYYYDFSYKTIAELLQLNLGTVKTRINRAKGKMHHLLS